MADHAGYNQPIIDEFRANGGTVEHFGRGLVLLHHIGAKSGEERVSPVAAVKTGDGEWLVAGSKAGAPEHPAWYHNLLAHPDVTIETPDDGDVSVHVTDLKGADHDAAWQLFTGRNPGFLDYQSKTSRVIPVLRLTRR
ncbi:nitroreductase/quinone reductase family protein [Humibacter ginsenosidimutans]|uniref:Nitroreductase family deazaflavin-dependent oxidoreductase n=1 Tax=Humibacter ginsenosidimutans TaxID=2599293 RepID=A0A5B8M491_9MICO|nr:nitroreductase/quinone reductase family protein [Humibacter ginsenosidimutans]QDZ14595.1 nitroreductase family deazaflavin-dependent oxidoreductase [Humibacter ginsenosidimutans]